MKHYGWRAGTPYVGRGASVADTLRYEIDACGNTGVVALLPLTELERVAARDYVWVTKTRHAALAYATRDTGAPYKVFVDWGCVAAQDGDGGYYVKEN